MIDSELAGIAEKTLQDALAAGAQQAAVRVSTARFIEVKQRAGQIEGLESSTSRGLTLSLYVDGRYSSNATSLLQPAALQEFLREALAMTRVLTPDPFRALADPELYGPTDAELEIHDAGYDEVPMAQRLTLVDGAERAARAADAAIISATSEVSTQQSELLQIHSNGFRGTHRATSYYVGVEATARDEGDRRPEDYAYAGARFLDDLPAAAELGAEAARRALARRGARKLPSAKTTLVVENRAAGRLIGSLLSPLHGAALQQRRSCFEGRLGTAVGSALLDLRDDPLRRRGLASRTFDGDGLAAKELPIFVGGELRSFFIDVYYGRKLSMPPTTGSGSNLILTPGARSLPELLAAVGEGILVSSFLGGNANPATGDFSFGISGFAIRGGALAEPINEMNIADNHTALWQRLIDVGNDPYPYGSSRIPSLVFGDVQFAGS